MRILFVTSEAYPLIKTGGLADVSGSLPAALQELGHDVRILIPGYRQVFEKLHDLRKLIDLRWLPMVDKVTLLEGCMPSTGVPLFIIACPHLYERDGGPYLDPQGQEWVDNPLRFGTLSRVAAILANKLSPLGGWQPDIVHCNDWQSGLTPAFTHHAGASCAKLVQGIHNMAFQGNFSPAWVTRLGLPAHAYHMEGVEFHGHMSFLKAGINYADSIITVSPTYAREIQTAEFGCGLEGLLVRRSRAVHGILNGIDMREWNPASDPHLVQRYDSQQLERKQAVKQALQESLGLEALPTAPLLGVVSRLTHQKGLDLLLQCLPVLLQDGCQLALLGEGDSDLEHGYWKLAMQHPQQVSVNIGYNEPLSHQIIAGADIFIMPSRFEPCGLNQMYALRYGTPPVVRRTGGLADSVQDSTLEIPGNGFVFDHAETSELLAAIRRAITCYADPALWQTIQRNGMACDLGWAHSAQTYLAVYQSLL